MRPTEIRLAGTDDLSVLCELDHIARTDGGRWAFIERAIAERRAWVIRTSKTAVGYGVLRHDFFDRSFIEMVYVGEDFRSRGFGPELIRFMETHSRSGMLFTSTNESNVHMRHVLEGLGYERSGIIENLDPGDPELIYCKRLRTD